MVKSASLSPVNTIKSKNPTPLFRNDESCKYRKGPCEKKKKKKNQISALSFFFSSDGARKDIGTPLLQCCFDFIPFIFHLSVNASSAFRLDQKLSVHFLCYNTEITVQRVSHRTIGGIQLFKCFRNGFGLFRRRHTGRSPKNTAGSCWLDKTGACSLVFILSLMPILNCPCHYYNRFSGDG